MEIYLPGTKPGGNRSDLVWDGSSREISFTLKDSGCIVTLTVLKVYSQ